MAVDLTAIGLGVETSKLRQGTKDLDAFGRSANKAAGQADQSTKAMSGMTSIAGKLAVVLGAAGLGRSLITAIDANTKYTAQLKLATQSQAQFNTALADVQRIARTAQSDLGSIATLYARLNSSLRDLGVTQNEVARITENVGLALKVSGATAAEASSAIMQLSQAFASGVLRGEEFNAVSESAPALMRALADSIGVPIGQLRMMAAEGQITGEILNKAFGDEKLLAKFREQAKEVQTISGAFTQLKNSLGILAGEVSNTTGVGVSFADILSTIARNIESVANVIKGDLKSAFDSILPAYREFKKLQDKENSRALPQATTPAGAIIPQGSRIDQPLRRDLGLITDINETTKAYSELQKQLDGLRKDNPLKDITAANQEYAQALAIVRANVLAMNLTQEEGKRYEAQLKKDWENATKGSKEYGDAEKKRREDVLKDIQNEIDFEMDIKETRDSAELKAIEDIKEAKLKADKELNESREKYMAPEQKRANDNFKEAQDIYKKQVDEYERIFDRANENLSRSLTDSIIRGFDNGKKFIQNFKDAISNAFKGYVVNIGVNFIQNALSGVTGAIGKSIAGVFGMGASGAAVAGGDGVAAAGLLDQAKNIFNVVTKGFDTANIAFEQGIQEFGTWVTDFGSVGESLGGMISQYSGAIASALPYAGAVLSLLQGDVKGAAFQGAGVAIGSAIGGPIGGAIGGALGSLVGGLFGGEDIPMTGDQAVTKFKDGQLSTSTNTFGKSSLGGGGGLQQANEIFAQSLGSLMKAFGDTSELIVDSIYRSRTNTQGFLYVNGRGVQEGSQKGISFEDFLKKMLGPGLAEAIKRSTAIPLAIRDLFSGIKDHEKVQAMIGAVVALNNATVQLSDRFGLTVENAAKLSKETGLVGDDLVAFINKLAGVAQSVKTPAQQILEYKAALTDQLGGSLPATIDAFDSVLKSFNTTTEAGRALFIEMFNLRDAFLQFNNAIAGVKKGVDDAIFSLLSPQQQALQNRARLEEEFAKFNLTVPKTTQQLIAIGEGIDYTTEAGLTLALAFPLLVQAFQAINSEVLKLNNALSPERFRTFTDFVIAQSYSSYGQPIPAANMPSYDVGTSYVPQTGAAMIHQGERILTRSENQDVMMNSGKVVSLLSSLVAKVSVLEYDMKRTADGTQRTARELEDITGGDVTITTQAA